MKIKSYITIKNDVVHKNGVEHFDYYKDWRPQPGGSRNMPAKGGFTDFLLALYTHFSIDYPRFYKMDTLCKLGWLASELLLEGQALTVDYRPEEIGIVLANASSCLDTDLKYIETMKDIPSPSLFVYTLPSIVIGEISIRNRFKGESAFFVSRHFDKAFMQSYVEGLMEEEVLKACIFGWVEWSGAEGEAELFLAENKKDK